MAKVNSIRLGARVLLVLLIGAALLRNTIRLLQWPVSILLLRYVILPYLIQRRQVRGAAPRTATLHRNLTILAVAFQALGYLTAENSGRWEKGVGELFQLFLSPRWAVYLEAWRTSFELRRWIGHFMGHENHISSFADALDGETVWSTLSKSIVVSPCRVHLTPRWTHCTIRPFPYSPPAAGFTFLR